MEYPGRVIRAGEADADVVRALKQKLDSALAIGGHPELRLDPENPYFGPRMERTVRLFQARHVDATGHPLVQDGEIGVLTWAALFGSDTVPERKAADDPLLARMLAVAAGEERKKSGRCRKIQIADRTSTSTCNGSVSAPATPGAAPSRTGRSTRRQPSWGAPIRWSKQPAVSITGTARDSAARDASPPPRPWIRATPSHPACCSSWIMAAAWAIRALLRKSPPGC